MKRQYLFILLVVLTLLHHNASACKKVVVIPEMDLTEIFSHNNTRFLIKENIDLDGKVVRFGENCTLVFRGGSLSNGTIVGNNTKVLGDDYEIFKRGYTRYRAYTINSSSPILVKKYHCCLIIEGTWNNKTCKPNWTGLLDESNEDVMLAVKNYAVLHKKGTKVKYPSFVAMGYDSTILPEDHYYDFCGAVVSYPDNLQDWEDITLPLPLGATPSPLESGYGLISLRSNSVIANLSLDGKSGFRQNEIIRLGVSCMIAIGNSENITLDNISITNVLGPAVTVQSQSKNIQFKNCCFHNIGEHIIYSHQYQGYCRFDGCSFDTWDSERLSDYRNGMNYLYKFDPPSDLEDIEYDISFTNCTINNPKRISAKGRTLGGFFTGCFPITIRINNCQFLGELPAFNPGGGSSKTDKMKKPIQLIIDHCVGSPYVYASNGNFNIITEFYNCKSLPFRTAYAIHYEDCELYLDVYEVNTENISSVFESEFSKPLIVRNCTLTDNGHENVINHPVFHRPILFEDCIFKTNVVRDRPQVLLNVQRNINGSIVFERCKINLPGFKLIGGNKEVEELIIQRSNIINLDPVISTAIVKKTVTKGNSVGEELQTIISD